MTEGKGSQMLQPALANSRRTEEEWLGSGQEKRTRAWVRPCWP